MSVGPGEKEMKESTFESGAMPGSPEENPPGAEGTKHLDEWLSMLVAQGGSDLLLISGAPACIRLEGKVQPIGSGELTGPQIEAAVLPALIPRALRQSREEQISDSSYRVSGVGRFRINLHRERGKAAAAVRALPGRVPLLEELHLPAAVEVLSKLPRGLVLIGGPAGAGKSTTVASLGQEINRREPGQITTH